jgi:hypothetical protein
MADNKAKRTAALQRWSQLNLARASWVEHWKELAHYLLPRSGRFSDTGLVSQPNYGGKKHMHLLDTTGTRALNILTAGLLSGASSPARPWFKLKTPDSDLNKREAVKRWLYLVEERMRDVFNQSNTYRAFRQVYQELGAFGTGANLLLPHYEEVINNQTLTIGEYAFDLDDDGNVNSLYRRFEMTVGQLVQRFGYKNCSRHVKAMYDRGQLVSYVPVLHAIEPRRERDPLKMDSANMPWASCYYEFGANEEEILRVSGFRDFPVQGPRWETRGADVYGSGPGMIALGYVKQLQHQALRKGQAIDFQTLPPLGVPPSAQGRGLNLNPGAVNYVDVGTTGAKSLIEAPLRLDYLLQDITDTRGQVNSTFYVDLFLLLANDERQQPATAREIAERHEEKLLMLGPVLESLHDEFLGPYVEQAFAHMLESGLVPPPPPELEGVQLNIQFVSMLAQAQRLVGLSSVERLIGSVVSVAAIKPDVIDKIDLDRTVEVYSDMLGTDPTLIVAAERVALIREQRQAAQAQAQQMAMAQQGAAVAKDLGSAGSEGRDAAVDAARQLGIV